MSDLLQRENKIWALVPVMSVKSKCTVFLWLGYNRKFMACLKLLLCGEKKSFSEVFCCTVFVCVWFVHSRKLQEVNDCFLFAIFWIDDLIRPESIPAVLRSLKGLRACWASIQNMRRILRARASCPTLQSVNLDLLLCQKYVIWQSTKKMMRIINWQSRTTRRSRVQNISMANGSLKSASVESWVPNVPWNLPTATEW